jgi:hypothetical protein
MTNPNVIKQVVIEREGKNYFVSTVLPPMGLGNRYETMVFNCTPDGKVTNWTEILVKYYSNQIDAINGHNEIEYYWHP